MVVSLSVPSLLLNQSTRALSQLRFESSDVDLDSSMCSSFFREGSKHGHSATVIGTYLFNSIGNEDEPVACSDIPIRQSHEPLGKLKNAWQYSKYDRPADIKEGTGDDSQKDISVAIKSYAIAECFMIMERAMESLRLPYTRTH